MKKNGTTHLPQVVLVENQVSQFHGDMGKLISVGMATTEPSDWLTSAYSNLLTRARKMIDPSLLSYLGEPDEITNLGEMYLAVGQVALVTRVLIDEAARQEQQPMGFTPPSRES
jgi:hypothetical protein